MSWLLAHAIVLPMSVLEKWVWSFLETLQGSVADDAARAGARNAGEIAKLAEGFIGVLFAPEVLVISGVVVVGYVGYRIRKYYRDIHGDHPQPLDLARTDNAITVHPLGGSSIPEQGQTAWIESSLGGVSSSERSETLTTAAPPLLCALSASMPRVVRQQDVVELRYVLSGPNIVVTGSNIEAQIFKIQPTPKTTVVKLTVRLTAPSFSIVNPSTGRITRAKGADRRTHRLDVLNPEEIVEEGFLLTPRADAACGEDTPMLLEVEQGQARLAAVKLTTAVVADDAPMGAGAESSTANAHLMSGMSQGCDLEIEIASPDQNKTYRITVTGDIPDTHGGKPRHFENQSLGTISFRDDSGAKARTMLQGFCEIDAEDDLEGRINFAQSCGIQYWRLLPTEFRDFYWKEMHGKELTLRIKSQEPFIAWELVTPEKPGFVGEMFGLAFSIAHWGLSKATVSTLSVSDFVTISPRKGDKAALRSALDEVNFLNDTYGARTVAANVATVRRVIQGSGPQIVHFAGHGKEGLLNPQDGAIRLEGNGKFRSMEMTELAEGQERLLFLNGCETGRQAEGLAGIGGWATSAMVAGYAAFIGSYWNITDGVAKEAAQILYRELASGTPIGVALMVVRRQFFDHVTLRGRASWLAYTLHCCQPTMNVVLNCSENAPTRNSGAEKRQRSAEGRRVTPR